MAGQAHQDASAQHAGSPAERLHAEQSRPALDAGKKHAQSKLIKQEAGNR